MKGNNIWSCLSFLFIETSFICKPVLTTVCINLCRINKYYKYRGPCPNILFKCSGYELFLICKHGPLLHKWVLDSLFLESEHFPNILGEYFDIVGSQHKWSQTVTVLCMTGKIILRKDFICQQRRSKQVTKIIVKFYMYKGFGKYVNLLHKIWLDMSSTLWPCPLHYTIVNLGQLIGQHFILACYVFPNQETYKLYSIMHSL